MYSIKTRRLQQWQGMFSAYAAITLNITNTLAGRTC